MGFEGSVACGIGIGPDDAEGGVGIGASGFSLGANRFSIGDGGITNRFGFSNGRVGTGASGVVGFIAGCVHFVPEAWGTFDVMSKKMSLRV